MRSVVWSQGPSAPAPQPVGIQVNWEKSKLSPVQRKYFLYGVRLGEYDGVSHQWACPVRAELPEFFQRQDGGTNEKISEAPGVYGIHSRSHATRIASYETTSGLITLPNPEMGMAPR